MYASHSNGNSHVFSVFEEDLYVYNDDFIYVYIYIGERKRDIRTRICCRGRIEKQRVSKNKKYLSLIHILFFLHYFLIP